MTINKKCVQLSFLWNATDSRFDPTTCWSIIGQFDLCLTCFYQFVISDCVFFMIHRRFCLHLSTECKSTPQLIYLWNYIYSLVLLSTVAHQSHLIQHPKNFLPLHDVHGDELLGNNKKYTAETEINLRRVIGAFICLCPKAVTGTVQLQDER